MGIPRIIHQLSRTSHIPERCAGFVESWRAHHPAWEHRLWTEESVAALALPDPAMAPYAILRDHGGVFVDLAVEALQSIEPLLDGCTAAIGRESSLLASVPGHPVWNHILARGGMTLASALEDFPGRNAIRTLDGHAISPSDEDDTLFHVLRWDDATRDAIARCHTEHAPSPGALLRNACEVINPERADRPAEPGEALPLISALMVTCDRPRKAWLALECFRRQTYPNKELVIVITGTDETLARDVTALADPRIRIVHPERELTLGALRNLAVEAAAGSFICGWDDDDLFHPFRLELQMAHIRRTGAQASVLSRCTMWWVAVPRFAVSQRLWENSIMCRKDTMPRYPHLVAGEDSRMFAALLETACVAAIDEPRLYIYIVHGTNTWYPNHFNRLWQTAERTFEDERAARLHRELARDLPLDAYVRTC